MATKKKQAVVTLPSLASRPDYDYLNSASLTILSRGYLPEDTPQDQLKDTAVIRVNTLIDTAEQILGMKLSTLREGVRRGWVSPSSPVWSNFGTERGLPISCNGSMMEDSIDSIAYKVAEIGMMTKEGAGTSVYMSKLRPTGSKISGGGASEGPVHFARLVQEQVSVISQSNVRRGNAAIYLDIDHADIEEWLKMRSIIDGIHHPIQHLSFGVVIPDWWMADMLAEEKGGEKRKLLVKIINKRRATGYPYIMFKDNANKARPDRLKEMGLEILASNLCTEIMLHSTADESFVCNLSSLNLLYFDEWRDTDLVAELTYFLDAVLTEYIRKCRMSGRRLLADALRFAERWRALGIGTLGYHSYLQQNMIPFRSPEARTFNIEAHAHIYHQSRRASRILAEKYGEPEGMIGTGFRNLTQQAIAPTRSSSLILGQVSKGIEPWEANIFEDDNAKSTLVMKNKALEALLEIKGKNTDEVWLDILQNAGSVQHLDFLTDHEKAVFETFLEIGPDEVIQQAADRQPFVDQGQSLNLKIHPDTPLAENVRYIKDAWQKGLKSLYYHEGLNRAQEELRKQNACVACEA
ncbi:ribonucleotide-diphosphate reductase subunit alpha [Rhodobacteraceae bacterium R_SAG4]|nr:ribonucleotide-diphosphate reductase subunit alpha [Rhodobacteraceae bacterium R_SAG4]